MRHTIVDEIMNHSYDSLLANKDESAGQLMVRHRAARAEAARRGRAGRGGEGGRQGGALARDLQEIQCKVTTHGP